MLPQSAISHALSICLFLRSLFSRLVLNFWVKVHDTLGVVITGAQQVSHILEKEFFIPYGDTFLVPIVQMSMLGLRG